MVISARSVACELGMRLFGWPLTVSTTSSFELLEGVSFMTRFSLCVFRERELAEGADIALLYFGLLCRMFGKRGLLEKGSFQKSPFSRDSREVRDSRDFREPPDCGQ